MTYEQAILENPLISLSDALREIKEHSASVSEFFADCGKHENYTAQTVLYWLGY